MTNTTDKSILTAAGKALLAQLNAEEKPLVIDKMIFANVPNRPEFPQPDDVVPSDDVVHEAAVEQRGRLSVDSVIYSTTLTSQEGPFEFNWTGAYCSEYGVLVTIDHHALTPKTVDEPGVSGNTLVRSVVLEYKDIAEITNITVDASTWQYNATPRMKKMDDDVAQAIIDQNGKDWFIEDGFLVTPQASAFNIKAGAGYVSGNRVTLEFDRNVQVPNKPSFIYVDAHREGTPTGEQVTLFDFLITVDEKDDYTDANGVKHFVCKIAQVLGDGSVSDLRPEDLEKRLNNGVMEYRTSFNEHRKVREKLEDSVSVKDFGAGVAGSLNDTQSFIDAFNFANPLGLTVTGDGGTYIVDASESGIDVRTSYDFSDSTIICRTSEDKENYSRVYRIFSIVQEFEDVNHLVSDTELKKGSIQILSLAGKAGFVSIESTDIAMLRNDAGLSNVYKKEPAVISGKNGLLAKPLYFDFEGAESLNVRFKPFLSKIKCKLGKVDLSQANIASIVKCERNNVEASLPEIDIGDNLTSVYTPIEFKYCARIKAKDISLPQLGGDTNEHLGYLALLTMTFQASFKNIYQRDGWSGINGNWFRDLNLDEFELFSISCHAFGGDIYVSNGKVYRETLVQGYGDLHLRNVTHIVSGRQVKTDGSSFVYLRTDYAGTWDGSIKIRDCGVQLMDTSLSYSIVRTPATGYDAKCDSYWPNIDVKGFQAESVSGDKLLLKGWKSESSTDYLHKRYLPEFVRFEDVKITGDVKGVFLPVENRLDMSVNVPKSKRNKIIYRITNCEHQADELGERWYSNSFYGMRTLSLPESSNIEQVVYITASPYIALGMGTPFNTKAYISDAVLVGPWRMFWSPSLVTDHIALDTRIRVFNATVLRGTTGISGSVQPNGLWCPTELDDVVMDWGSYYLGFDSGEYVGSDLYTQITYANNVRINKSKYPGEYVIPEFLPFTRTTYISDDIYESAQQPE